MELYRINGAGYSKGNAVILVVRGSGNVLRRSGAGISGGIGAAYCGNPYGIAIADKAVSRSGKGGLRQLTECQGLGAVIGLSGRGGKCHSLRINGQFAGRKGYLVVIAGKSLRGDIVVAYIAVLLVIDFVLKYAAENNDLNYFIGREGVTHTALRPAGIGEFDGVKLNVVSDGEFIGKDKPIRVLSVKGNRIVVCEIIDKGE